MKKLTIALALSLMAGGSAYAATFVNGGFEDGNLGGWTGGGGVWYGSPVAPVSPATYAGGTPTNTLMSGGTDPYTGANTVFNGNNSVRVNNNVNNRSVSTISQSVTGYSDNSIFFAWNAVLEGSHGLTDSDYFSLTLRDTTDGVDLVSRAYSSAGAIGSGTTGVTWTNYSGIYSAGWVVENIDLTTAGAGGTSIVGHDFTLTLLASDCPYVGHWGYVYLDGFGAQTPTQCGQPGQPPCPTPEPDTLPLLGLGLLGLAFGLRRKHA